MFEFVAEAYRRIDETRPLVRPTRNQFEVIFFPPFGDPEVHVPSELGAYVVTGLTLNGIVELLDD
ncbi:hypothetical protein BRC60_02185 [Halobacteriales archaeon QH_1_68_42]|nr:MAG: hypothetical protein BRC60_02185 [Halobacteriales archaeon QH_1_68_42]